MTSSSVSPQPADYSPWDAMPEDPTPDEIRRVCQEIQSGWSDQERRYRAAVRRPRELDERKNASYITRA